MSAHGRIAPLSLGSRIVAPDPDRTPDFDTERPGTVDAFEIACATCGAVIQLQLTTFNSCYSDPESVLGQERSDEVKRHFGLRRDRSLAEGWPKLRVEACARCGARYLICVVEHEPHNGWYQFTLRGVTELVEASG